MACANCDKDKVVGRKSDRAYEKHATKNSDSNHAEWCNSTCFSDGFETGFEYGVAFERRRILDQVEID